jgi:uncharacterized protein (DUF2164 family)
LYVASNDVIRRFLNAQGFEGDAPVQQTLQFIAESFGIYLYEHKVSHIIDADLLKFYEAARNKAYSHGAKFYLIDIECADAVIRQRILDRGQEITAGTSDNLSRADIAEYERRKAIHQEVSRPSCDFTVHTDQPLEPQLQSIITRLQGDGVA